MEKSPKVSIIVPLYNQKRYFEKCLSSICEQTYKNIEVIVVNDGSTDNSPEIARRWASRDKRVKLIEKQNEGTAFARRDGLMMATGEFVAFVDNDDLLPKNSIEILLENMIEKNVDQVIGAIPNFLWFAKWNQEDFWTFPIGVVVKQPELYDKYYATFFGTTYFQINMWGRLYRKSVIDRALRETDLFDSDVVFLGEDYYFNMKLFPYIKSMYRTDETVYYYRYGGQFSHFNRHYPQLFTLSDIRLAILDQRQYQKGYGPLFAEYVNLVYYHAQQLMEFKKVDKNEIIAFFRQELETRALVPRLDEYYKLNGTTEESIDLLINRDYEGMYYYAQTLLTARLRRFRYRAKRALLFITEHLF